MQQLKAAENKKAKKFKLFCEKYQPQTAIAEPQSRVSQPTTHTSQPTTQTI
ncbi:MAG: hypothetical protein LBR45_00845 [Bacteroidales bacterium]|jgi:hypothetical protein|nr:hypothetical protein [Bacteroidales bacterium]